MQKKKFIQYEYFQIIKFKKTSEIDVIKQKEVLHHAIENRVLLKTIIKKNIKTKDDTDSDSDSDSVESKKEIKGKKCEIIQLFTL